MGHRSIRVLRDRYKNLDEGFTDLEKTFQSQDETNRVERQALLNKISDKDESIKALSLDKDELIIDAHNVQKSLNEQVYELENDLRDKQVEADSFQYEITKLNAVIQRLTDEVEMAKSRGQVAQSSDAEMKMLQHSMLRLREMMEEEGVAYREQITTLQQRLEEALSNKPRKDDLTEINGVGPKIENILNENGVFSFNDLADVTQETLSSIREQLGGLSDRIERDDWVGQAKARI